jgi:phage anti-repressor protein
MTNKELIPITEHNGKRAVNARDLHAFLNVGRDFSNWIKERIEKYDLIENEDYQVFAKFGENFKGGRSKIEYALSMDCAKELSMVEGNERGKQARRYFIACEKKLKEITEGKELKEPENKIEMIDFIKSTLVELMPGVVVQVFPSSKHGFLMTVYETAKALGRHWQVINSRRKESQTLIEGEHYIVSNQFTFDRDAIEMQTEMFTTECVLKMGQNTVLWTRKGIIRLCETIHGGQSNWVKDWAENYTPVTNLGLYLRRTVQVMPKNEKLVKVLGELFSELSEKMNEN